MAQSVAAPQWGAPTNAPMTRTAAGTLAVNAANLDLSFHIPIVSKPGRGVPFTYSLTYNSDIFGVFNSAWEPLSADVSMGMSPGQASVTGPYDGWLVGGTAAGGTLSNDTEQGSCVYTYYYYGGSGQVTEYYSVYTNYRYYDINGNEHDFPGQTNTGNDCQSASSNLMAESAHGWQLKITGSSANVIGPDGTQYLGANGPTEDTNGNFVTGSVDTTGTTMLSSTSGTNCYNPVDGNTYPNCVTYTVPSPGSGTVSWTEYLQNIPIASDSCSGLANYSATASLPVFLVMPEGPTPAWYYKFGYDGDGRVNSVRWPAGGTTTISYGSLCALQDGGPQSVTVTENDQNGNNDTTVYSRSYGQTTIQYPDNPENTGTAEQVIDWNGSGWPTEWQWYDQNSGPLLKDVQFTWGSPWTQKIYLYNNGSPVEMEETDTTLDSYGLPSQITQIDYGRDPTGNTKKITKLAFSDSEGSSYTSLNILNIPASMEVTDGGGNIISERVWGLDNYSLASPAISPYQWDSSKTTTRGLVNFNTVFITPSHDLSSKLIYDDTGELVSTTAINGNQTGPGYSSGSCYEAYATSQGAPGGAMTNSFDCATGLPLNKKGPNGNVYLYGYDAYGRLASIADPDGGGSAFSYPTPNETEDTVKVDASRSETRYMITDGFGRPVFQQVNGDTVETKYDAMGRVLSVSEPYTDNNHPPGTGVKFSSYSYDGLGRVNQTVTPDGSITNSQYRANEEVIGNALKTTVMLYGGFGHLWKVCQASSQPGNAGCGDYLSYSGFEAVYTYDMIGRLLQVSQDGGTQTRNWTYDLLGRKLSSQQPEFNNGTETFTYDSVSNSVCPGGSSSSGGDLILTTNAAGQSICYQYDLWNRVTDKSLSTGQSYAYQYDQSGVSNGLGRMTTASAGTGTITYAYDSLGQASQVQENFGKLGITDYTYNYVGQPVQMVLPTGRTVNETYDSNAELTQIQDNNTGVNYMNSRTYNAAGQITGENIGGSALTIAESYNDDGQPWQITNTPGNSPQTILSYYWGNSVNGSNGNVQSGDDAGELHQMTDSANANLNMSYQYDDLGRLENATEADQIIRANFSDDPFGNRTGETGTLTTQFSVNTATNQIVGNSYDGAGRMTAATWGGNSIAMVWDASGQMTSLQIGSNSNQLYGYDPFGRKISSGVVSRLEYYFYGANTGNHPLAEYNQVLNQWQSNIMNGGQLIATVAEASPINLNAPAGVNYQAMDMLGTMRETVDSGGTASPFQTWYPYGESGNGAASSEYMWTNMRRNSSTGLDHFQFRDYSYNLGRWLSPDPAGMAVVSLADPQSFNRYSYVENQPVMFRDLNGEMLTLGEMECWCDLMNDITVDGVPANSSFYALSGDLVPCPNNACETENNVGLPIQFNATTDGDYYSCMVPGSWGTSNAAGIAAATCAMPESAATNKEYSGEIYETFNNTYSFTLPVQGTLDTSMINPSAIPENTIYSGNYHTHTDNINYYFEMFSPQDINNGNSISLKYNNQYLLSLLGTPLGRIEIYIPAQSTIYPNGCVLIGNSVSIGPTSNVAVPQCQ